MSSLWIEKLIPKNPYSRPGTKLQKVVKIINHFTANPGASAFNHYKYFGFSLVEQNNRLPKNKRRYASAQIFVDKNEAYLIIPLDEVAYAANDGSYRGIQELKPNANYKSISVELCIENDGTFHPETIKRAAQINAELCRMFDLDPLQDVVRHYDVTHKNCPAPWVKEPEKFDEFKKLVRADLTNKTLGKLEEKIIMELNQVQKEMVDRLKTLKITDGNDPEKPATQLYVWTLIDELRRVVYTDINKVKSEFRGEISDVKKQL